MTKEQAMKIVDLAQKMVEEERERMIRKQKERAKKFDQAQVKKIDGHHYVPVRYLKEYLAQQRSETIQEMEEWAVNHYEKWDDKFKYDGGERGGAHEALTDLCRKLKEMRNNQNL